MRYGRLTLVREVPPPKFNRGERGKWALFRCDCGKEKTVRLTVVVNGHTRSCGCAAKESFRRQVNAGIKEGLAYAAQHAERRRLRVAK